MPSGQVLEDFSLDVGTQIRSHSEPRGCKGQSDTTALIYNENNEMLEKKVLINYLFGKGINFFFF